MPGEHTIAGLKQFGVTGELMIVKRPIRVIIELLVPFVEPICGREERNRIRHMNCDRHVQLSAGVPHGIESRVFAQVQTQCLQNF